MTAAQSAEGSSQAVQPADIPVVILCGGMGTRLREASEQLPKGLVDVGGRPILWHIMKLYSAHGFRKFVLCLGYKGDMIKSYFLDSRVRSSDLTLHTNGAKPLEFHTDTSDEDWEITFVETGLTTATGARIARAAKYLDAPRFALTYGDGIGSVDVSAALEQHVASGRTGTLTGVHPSGRYGEMQVEGDAVKEFNEKPTTQTDYVNGGFFFFERPFVEGYLDADRTEEMLEHVPLGRLARDGQLGVYKHEGYWLGMDTFRDWKELNGLWDAGKAEWKIWRD
ncbi:MAG: sugar phosphate nucleotidyltransferase [Quadrisphaera sp.]